MDRIEVDPSLPAVRIAAPILNDLCRHALDADPNECCGLILSDGARRFASVRACRNVMTKLHAEDPQKYPRDARSAYYIPEEDVLAICREAERSGGEVSAVYHSHVGARAYLSDLDLAYAQNPWFPFPEADQIVLSVLDGSVCETGLFRRSGEDFRGHRVDAEPT